jgi:superfamily II DNA helicase RecQ
MYISVILKSDAWKDRLKKSATGMYEAVGEQVVTHVQSQGGTCGIIYCTLIEDCRRVATLLGVEHGIEVGVYHGDMSIEARRKVYVEWFQDKCKIVVATSAFGMGVDKANVRWILHYTLPPSMEACLQEMGRAGRDGNRGTCTVLYSPYDVDRMAQKLHNELATQHILGQKLGEVKRFCDNTEDRCRHWWLMKHFDDPSLRAWKSGRCGDMCDICEKHNKSTTTTAHTLPITNVVSRLESKRPRHTLGVVDEV